MLNRISVVGKFNWNESVLSYSGLIGREEEGFKLKVENYSSNLIARLCQDILDEERGAKAFSERGINAEDVHSVLCPSSTQ